MLLGSSDELNETDKSAPLELPHRKEHTSKFFHGCVPIRRSFSMPRSPMRPSNFFYQNLGLVSDKPDFKESISCSSQHTNRFEPTEDQKLHPQSTLRVPKLDIQTSEDTLSSPVTSDRGSYLTTLSEDSSRPTSPSPFHDPLLDELDSCLPAPPAPPRAYPPWLKQALVKNIPFKSASSGSVPDPYLGDQASTFPRATEVLTTGRFDVRICPVLQNGVKISDTHYWLLDPPRSIRSAAISRSMSEHAHGRPNDEHSYLNMNREIFLRRRSSEAKKEALLKFHHDLTSRLMKEIPTATEAECQAVLIGSSYDYNEAVKRLKLELLCRKGYVSRRHWERILSSCDWDFDAALVLGREENKMHKRRRRERSSRVASDNNEACSLNPSSSTSSPHAPQTVQLLLASTSSKTLDTTMHSPSTEKKQNNISRFE